MNKKQIDDYLQSKIYNQHNQQFANKKQNYSQPVDDRNDLIYSDNDQLFNVSHLDNINIQNYQQNHQNINYFQESNNNYINQDSSFTSQSSKYNQKQVQNHQKMNSLSNPFKIQIQDEDPILSYKSQISTCKQTDDNSQRTCERHTQKIAKYHSIENPHVQFCSKCALDFAVLGIKIMKNQNAHDSLKKINQVSVKLNLNSKDSSLYTITKNTQPETQQTQFTEICIQQQEEESFQEQYKNEKLKSFLEKVGETNESLNLTEEQIAKKIEYVKKYFEQESIKMQDTFNDIIKSIQSEKDEKIQLLSKILDQNILTLNGQLSSVQKFYNEINQISEDISINIEKIIYGMENQIFDEIIDSYTTRISEIGQVTNDVNFTQLNEIQVIQSFENIQSLRTKTLTNLITVGQNAICFKDIGQSINYENSQIVDKQYPQLNPRLPQSNSQQLQTKSQSQSSNLVAQKQNMHQQQSNSIIQQQQVSQQSLKSTQQAPNPKQQSSKPKLQPPNNVKLKIMSPSQSQFKNNVNNMQFQSQNSLNKTYDIINKIDKDTSLILNNSLNSTGMQYSSTINDNSILDFKPKLWSTKNIKNKVISPHQNSAQNNNNYNFKQLFPSESQNKSYDFSNKTYKDTSFTMNSTSAFPENGRNSFNINRKQQNVFNNSFSNGPSLQNNRSISLNTQKPDIIQQTTYNYLQQENKKENNSIPKIQNQLIHSQKDLKQNQIRNSHTDNNDKNNIQKKIKDKKVSNQSSLNPSRRVSIQLKDQYLGSQQESLHENYGRSLNEFMQEEESIRVQMHNNSSFEHNLSTNIGLDKISIKNPIMKKTNHKNSQYNKSINNVVNPVFNFSHSSIGNQNISIFNKSQNNYSQIQNNYNNNNNNNSNSIYTSVLNAMKSKIYSQSNQNGSTHNHQQEILENESNEDSHFNSMNTDYNDINMNDMSITNKENINFNSSNTQ